MQAQAAEFSGYAEKLRCFFGGKSFKTVCFDSFILKRALKQTRSVCLRAEIIQARFSFCVRRGSNPQPSAPEADALSN
jgi:hypothetical protein